MTPKFIYLCEDTVDGIFTAIYKAWSSKRGHANNEIQVRTDDFNHQLFCEYISVETDFQLSQQVARSIQTKLSSDLYQSFLHATASYDSKKADTIYRVMILAFSMGTQVMNHLTNPYVQHLFQINRNVGNEAHFFKEFLRFVQLKNGLLLGKIRPKNDVLPFVALHFEDRFPDEDFIIADMGRNSLILHAKGKPMSFTNMIDFDLEAITTEYSSDEQKFQDLFAHFIKTIALEPRLNEKLQQQMLPLRYREFMPEYNR